MADDATVQIANAAIKEKFPDLPDELIASLTPDQMSMLAGSIGGGDLAPAEPEGGEGGEAAGATPMQDTPAADMAAGMTMSRDEMINALVAQGEDPGALQAMTDEDLAALYQQKVGGGAEAGAAAPMSEDFFSDADFDAPREQAPARAPKKVTMTQQFAERRIAALERRLKAAEAQQRRVEALSRQRQAQEQRAAVRAFCERLVHDHKASPAEVEFSKQGQPVGPIAFALVTADATRKFAEHGGKTALETLMMKLEQRPSRNFGEQVPDPLQAGAGRGGDLSPERERQLLSHTRAGRRVLAQRAEREADHRAFAETLGRVIGQRLNGRN